MLAGRRRRVRCDRSLGGTGCTPHGDLVFDETGTDRSEQTSASWPDHTADTATYATRPCCATYLLLGTVPSGRGLQEWEEASADRLGRSSRERCCQRLRRLSRRWAEQRQRRGPLLHCFLGCRCCCPPLRGASLARALQRVGRQGDASGEVLALRTSPTSTPEAAGCHSIGTGQPLPPRGESSRG